MQLKNNQQMTAIGIESLSPFQEKMVRTAENFYRPHKGTTTN